MIDFCLFFLNNVFLIFYRRAIEVIEDLKKSFSESHFRRASREDANILAKYEGQNMNLVHVTSENGRFNHNLNTKDHGMIKVSFEWGTQG